MKLVIYLLLTAFIFGGCAKESIPNRDISNAKMALAQADNATVREYAPSKLKILKKKLKKVDLLLKKGEYKDAKFLAQTIQAESMLVQKEASVNRLKKEIKTKEQTLHAEEGE